MVFASTFRRALFAHSAPATYLALGRQPAPGIHPAASTSLGPAAPTHHSSPPHVSPVWGHWEQSGATGSLSLRWHAAEPFAE